MKLKLGMRVTDGKRFGTVCKAGPYGDQPFQIKLEGSERYVSFIWEDGTCAITNEVWVEVKK